MKILLDEQLPVKLKYRFDEDHHVSTVRDMKWLGMKDQELFSKIKEENFELFITNDQNLKFQVNKNNPGFSFPDLNSSSNRYDDLLSIMPVINEKLMGLMKAIDANKRANNCVYLFEDSDFQVWHG